MFSRLLPFIFVLTISALPCLAQTQDAPPAQGSSPAATSASSNSAPVAQKKVWTNENLPEAKTGVSVFGDKRNKNYHMTPDPPADPAQIKKSLEKLQGQLDDVIKKLKTYKEFQDGEAVSKGERDLDKSYSRTPVDQQMVKLLEKKKDLETQIGDLVDDARKKGVDPGQLR